MVKTLKFSSILRWLKLFTYLSATLLLLTKSNVDQLTYLIPLALLISFIDYTRDYYLVEKNKPLSYLWISIVIEMLCIMAVAFFDKNDVNILFFFVLISSTIIVHPFAYSLPLAAVFILWGFLIHGHRNGFTDLFQTIVPLTFSYVVSTAFVMGMSYVAKMQIREKERLARLNGELEQAYKKLIDHSAIAQKLTIEEERTRMARELHDTLAHTLTTLIIQLETCKKLVTIDPTRLPTELEKAQELSRSGFNDIKRSIKDLRPQAMEDKSFFASIASIIHETMENTNVQIKFNNLISQEIDLTTQMEVALFRAVQESITNSIRHGHSDKIEMILEEKNNRLHLCIEDNGQGCSNIKKGYGMKGIRERIEGLEGSVSFSSAYGHGFKTEISLPCKVVA